MMHTFISRGSFFSCYFLGVLFTVSIGLSSCGTSKNTAYFKTIKSDTTIHNFISNDFESRIRVGDQLGIKVTSLSPAEDEQFNKAAAISTEASQAGFMVHPDGTVLLHRLGRVTVSGLTRRELAAQLQKDLLPYMKDPIVHVQYLNHSITVLGAVGKPQVMPLPQEQMSIIDVLVKSGDISKNGMKDKVILIREEGRDKKVKYLNLEDHAIFTSPWFYVQPNDIVYVPEDNIKTEKQEKQQRFQTTMTLVASSISLFIIIVERIFR